jgi:uncharacterized DUF497 family protein
MKRWRIQFSHHALEKLNDANSIRLEMTSSKIKAVLDKPVTIDTSDYPALIAVGELTKTLSLCVVYKFVEEGIRVITFYPARKGRYESKILS